VRAQIGKLAPGAEVELVIGDLGTKAGVDSLLAHPAGRAIGVLVNNAGFGTHGEFAAIGPGREHQLAPRPA
jgi:short-subunit dehydrogenase